MTSFLHDELSISRQGVSRRRFLHTLSAAAMGTGLLSFRDQLALHANDLRQQGRSLILLWMQGGPSQLETFDPKPHHENGGGTKVIQTSVPGVQIARDWERTASIMNEIALIRSMTNKEGNHQRATYQMHTGYIPSGSVKHPAFGSCVAQQLADPEAELPSVVSIGRTQGAGFLGVDYEPFVVDNPGQMPANLSTQRTDARFARRLGLLGQLEEEFGKRGAASTVASHRQLYDKASKLVLSPQTVTFDLSQESVSTRDRYGNTQFGRGCLLARRLVESGVTFVEVRSNGWDSHQDNFEQVSARAAEVDPASASLIEDLRDRGMLEHTVVVWAGEFGRTPRVNARGGRDHYPRAFNVWVAGGGIQGGQVIGETTADGAAIADRPVEVNDFLQSISQAVGIDASHENISPLGRPMKIVDGGEPVTELFG
ncbi:MAG: DUF1501 domain-containing protein [Planctomycetaceae bacterium]|nr:DUF1501 domain-containing protein [Planctomycetaceae bacterium]